MSCHSKLWSCTWSYINLQLNVSSMGYAIASWNMYVVASRTVFLLFHSTIRPLLAAHPRLHIHLSCFKFPFTFVSFTETFGCNRHPISCLSFGYSNQHIQSNLEKRSRVLLRLLVYTLCIGLSQGVAINVHPRAVHLFTKFIPHHGISCPFSTKRGSARVIVHTWNSILHLKQTADGTTRTLSLFWPTKMTHQSRTRVRQQPTFYAITYGRQH
jgi:hypothetical protein